MATQYTWERRISRAEQLAQSAGHSQKIIAFYLEVLKWQHELYKQIAAASIKQPLTGSFETDHVVFLDRLGSLLDLAKRRGSEALAAQADELIAEKDVWKEFLASYWNGDPAPDQGFFARVCLQPYLESLAKTHTMPFDSRLAEFSSEQIDELVEVQPRRFCPFCGRKPQLAFLSAETSMPGLVEGGAQGGRRFLMCGDCLSIWPFQRISCVNCREEDPNMLPYYSAVEIPNIRIECCDSCRHYIKSIDLTKDNRLVPPVDEIAAIPLDLWAREQGYRKVFINLAGL